MKDTFEAVADRLLSGSIFLQEAVEILERCMIRGALERSGGKQCAASKLLGIHRNTLQRKMEQYGLGNGRSRARRKPVARAGRPRKSKLGAA
jgi:DNA-binding NtrC family response regulator